MISTIIALVCAAVSCEPKVDPEKPLSESKMEFSFASGDYQYCWPEDASVKYYNTVNVGSLGTASIVSGQGTVNGVFEFKDKLEKGLSVRAVYPSSRMMSGKNILSDGQNQEDASAPDFSKYIYCYSDVFESGKAKAARMNHAFAYVCVKVGSAKLEGTSLNGVSIKSADTPLAGGYKFDFEKNAPVPTGDVYDKVKVGYTTPVALGEKLTEAWIVCFPASLEGKNVDIEFELSTEGSSVFTQTVSTKGHDLVAGQVTTITVSDFGDASIIKGDPDAKEEYTTQAMNFKAQPKDAFKSYQARTAGGMNRMDKIRYGFSNQDKWGGFEGVTPHSYISTNPGGFWRTGRWHDRTVMVDPDGNVALIRGMNYVCPEPFCNSSTPTTQAYFEAKYKNMDQWAAETSKILTDLGFNMFMTGPSVASNYRFAASSGYGISTTMEEKLHNPEGGKCFSQIEWLNFLITFWWDYKNITRVSPTSEGPWPAIMFDPSYLSYIDQIAKAFTPNFVESRYFIGYYSDNEINFCDTGSRTTKTASLKNFLALKDMTAAAGYPRYCTYAYNWAVEWMRSKYGTTTYSEDMEPSFMEAVADYYYRTAAEAIKRYDPNHLYLGSRLHYDSKHDAGVLRACARWCDVVSLNYYDNVFEPVESYFGGTLKENCGEKPYIVTEFYVKDMVSDPLYVNEGAGDFVDSQKARGLWYSNFCIKLIEEGNCAGWQWFKYYDDWYNTGYVNKGILKYDESGTYTDAVSLMEELNRNSYKILEYYTDLEYQPHIEEGGGIEDPFGAGTFDDVIWE